MIQGHTFTVLARQSAFTGTWLRIYNMIHGLTAPMFLIGGGLAYGMVSLRRRQQGSVAGLDFRVLRRGLTLVLIGFALQVPRMTLWKIPLYPEKFKAMFSVGPLQLVGACLILCELVLFAVKSRRIFNLVVGLFALSIALVSPWLWQQELSKTLFPAFGMWLDGHSRSQFPFFPTAGYFMLGVLASQGIPFALRAPKRAALGLMALGAGTSYGLYQLYQGGVRLNGLYGEHDFWRAGPMHFTFRVGVVAAFLGTLMLLEPLTQRVRKALPTTMRTFDVLSRQSLVAYVFHLLILYGNPFTAGLVRFGRIFELWEATLFFLAVALHTVSIAVLWEHFQPASWPRRLVRKLRAYLAQRASQRRPGESEPVDELSVRTREAGNVPEQAESAQARALTS